MHFAHLIIDTHPKADTQATDMTHNNWQLTSENRHLTTDTHTTDDTELITSNTLTIDNWNLKTDISYNGQLKIDTQTTNLIIWHLQTEIWHHQAFKILNLRRANIWVSVVMCHMSVDWIVSCHIWLDWDVTTVSCQAASETSDDVT